MGKIPPAMMDQYKKAGKVGKMGAVGKGQKAPPFFAGNENAKEEKAEGLKGAAARREEKAEQKGQKSSVVANGKKPVMNKGKFPAFLKKK